MKKIYLSILTLVPRVQRALHIRVTITRGTAPAKSSKQLIPLFYNSYTNAPTSKYCITMSEFVVLAVKYKVLRAGCAGAPGETRHHYSAKVVSILKLF